MPCNFKPDPDASMPFTKETIVLATNNLGKLLEIESLLAGTDIEIESQQKYNVPPALETGLTFVENALIKARNACKHSGQSSIADDSGLEVDFLNGAPGLRSARFAGENATDQDNREKLLGVLKNLPPKKRMARFQCAMVYLRSPSDPSPLISLGTWEGSISSSEHGQNGFGYDPIFLIDNLNRTAAELTEAEKNQISHRGQALRGLLERLHL